MRIFINLIGFTHAQKLFSFVKIVLISFCKRAHWVIFIGHHLSQDTKDKRTQKQPSHTSKCTF